MPELNIWFFLIAAPAVVFAGISKGGFGSGAAFASSTILALIVEPGIALGIMLPLLMLVDAVTLRPYWKRWDGQAAHLLILGGVPGVALGAWFFTLVNSDVLRVLIGALSVGFVLWQLVVAPRLGRQDRLPDWIGVLAGGVAGFTSFVSHAGGPPAAVFLLGRRMSKLEYQASSVLVFWVINIAKFIPYAFLGMFTWQTLQLNVLLAPFAVLGAWLGVRLHWIIPERMFFTVTYVLLVITGAKLMWDGLT